MDADMSAALAPEALAPPIARDLGLPEVAVTGVLRLLAAGAQPAFLARFRPERTGNLRLRDLEHVQARAAHAVAFEFRRQQLRQELAARGPIDDELAALLASATHAVELEDVRIVQRKRKRGPAAKARARGLALLAGHLWACGSEGRLRGEQAGPADADPLALAVEHPGRIVAPKPKRKRVRGGRGRGEGRGAETTDDATSEAAASEDVPGSDASDPSHADETSVTLEGRADGAETATQEEGSSDDGAAAEEDPADAAVSDEGSADELAADHASAEEDGSADDGAGDDGSADERSAHDAGDDTAGDDTAGDDTSSDDDMAADDAEDDDADDHAAPSPERDLAGARLIAADDAFHVPELIRRLRDLVLYEGRIRATLVPGKKDKGGRYAKLAERSEPVAKANPGHLLGLMRGERDGALELHLEIDPERFDVVCDEVLGIDASRPCGAQLRLALHEAWMGAPGRAVRASARKIIKNRVDRQAIAELGEAYRPLLLAPALGPRPVLAIDPGFEPGCRLAVLGADGSVLARDTLFPLQPKLQVPQAKARVAELCLEHGVEAIAVTNGNGGRDIERLCREVVRETEALAAVVVVSADSDAAALFASSRLAKQELPDADASLRRAVSAGRRLQDPLTELAKIDPRKLGLGQHQHEVDQEELRAALEQVLVSCINEVGVDPNRASADQLARVAGISHALAKAIVSHREQHGPLTSRQALLDIPGVAGKAFEQAAGFLRIDDGDHALDRTAIHPERYGQVIEMAREAGVIVGDLVGNPELVDRLEPERQLDKPGATGEPLGRISLGIILDQLRHPGVDPRPPFEPVEFEPTLQSFEDLTVGMELTGVITHLATFGAFVNVGLPHEGLVHVSELTHGFISSPFEAVYVGQRVRGRVIEVTPDRKRFSLSLRALQPKPESKSRPGGKRRRRPDDDRGGQADRGQGERGPSDRGPGDRERGDRGPGDRGPGDRERGDRDRGGDRGDRGDRRDRGGPKGPGKGHKGGGGDRDRDRDRGGPKPQDKGDRVLNFKLDLSKLAERFQKG
jgi:uncharacterized protein